ncbi:hypothetical protein [Nevskia sp.]|uniref:hypothetical protein n=1 Tax=Nevskia sp. TaxID=1929292 RepID=UPI0025ED614E|nr:hypothetical protein [Nevskia sp.]
MRLAAGSLPWLVWQDLRLAFRGMSLGRRRLWPYLLYGGFLIGLHAVAGLVLYAMLNAPTSLSTERALQFSGVMLLSLEFFMLMAAMIGSFRLILAGRELSLHLSSPLPFERVLWMRVVSLIAGTWAISILLVTPVANMGALLGEPLFLLAYPVTVMMAMVTLALALFIIGLAVRLFGVVQARRVLQVVQALVPLGFVAVSLLSRDPQAKASDGGHGIASSGLAAHAHLVRLPALAMTGDLTALLSMSLLAGLSLVLATRYAAPAILQAVQSPDNAPPRQRRQQASGETMPRFRPGLLRVVMLKEWRTIVRDPRLAIALLAQPMLIVAFFYGNLFKGQYQLAAAVAATTFFAGQLSQYISNLMISAEEAPALLGASPRSRSQLIAYKCIAALAPVLLLMLLASLWAMAQNLWMGIVCLLCSFGAGFCACAVEVARPYPSPRRSFVQVAAARRSRDPLDIVSVLAMQFGWTAAAWFLANGNLWGAGIVLLVLLVPFFEWWRDANRQNLLGY